MMGLVGFRRRIWWIFLRFNSRPRQLPHDRQGRDAEDVPTLLVEWIRRVRYFGAPRGR